MQVQLARGKGIGTKDADLNKIGIWVNGPIRLGQMLLGNTTPMKLKIGDSEVNCYIGDSTTPIRGTNNQDVLIQLMVDIEPILIGAMLTNDLFLILGGDA